MVLGVGLVLGLAGGKAKPAKPLALAALRSPPDRFQPAKGKPLGESIPTY